MKSTELYVLILLVLTVALAYQAIIYTTANTFPLLLIGGASAMACGIAVMVVVGRKRRSAARR